MANYFAKKALGQHFLINPNASINLIRSLDLVEGDILLEIGPGRGALTYDIEKSGKYSKFILVELDDRFFISLLSRYKDSENIQVVHGNVLDYNFESINKVIGAIPYYITSPIIHKLVENYLSIDRFGLIIQDEVADKLTSKDSSYWNLYTFMYDKKLIDKLKPLDFNPPPKVSSASILFIKNNLINETFGNKFNIFKWDKFLHHMFQHPRKMINKVFDKSILDIVDVNPNLRPHQLKFDQIVNLYKCIYK